MLEIIESVGLFFGSLLAVCSITGAFIICERLFALRRSAVLPVDLVDAIIAGRTVSGGAGSVLARIIAFGEHHRRDEEAVKAFGRLEVNRMERGFVFVEIITGAAPLVGLLGTVFGLYEVFGNIPADTGVPDQSAFTRGIALALSTTILGLAIAIPCLVGGGYLQRRVESYAVQLESLIGRLYAQLASEERDQASKADSLET